MSMSWMGRMSLFGLVMWAAIAAIAQEPKRQGRFWLFEGDGYPVCDAFLGSLNALPPEEPALSCEQRVHASHPEFTRPSWEEMDIDANLRLIHQAESLLWMFTRPGTQAKAYDEWERIFRERVQSSDAKPRLRRTPFMLRENEPETLIWYEPIADKCRLDFERTGVLGQPGGHIFVLRTASGKLEDFNGTIGTQSRNDVLIYRGRYPYLTTAEGDDEIINGVARPVDSIGLHAVLPSWLIGDDRYFGVPRCYVHTGRASAE
jgi:hypothetical protein